MMHVPKFTKRQLSDGCRYLRRVDIEIQNEAVPRADGRVPTATDVRKQLTEVIHNLEREIEEREAKRRELQTAIEVLTEFSG